MLRVLIVDDSPTAHELIRGILNSDPEIEVVGWAKNGAEGVRLTQELRPDVLTMDIHMPVLDGFGATQKIMSTCPTPIVIVSATTLVHDVQWAMKALQAGALTLLMKPAGPHAPEFKVAAADLIETVKAMAEVKVVRRREPQSSSDAIAIHRAPLRARGVGAVAIAASTGGPPAILRVLSCLPVDFPTPILIVQHISAGFAQGFVSWLDAALPLRVKMAEQYERMQAGVVYIAPENQHLGVKGGGEVLLSDEEPMGGFRPSANYLFQSVGRQYRSNCIGVILTGMGNDGVDGLTVLKSSGGYVIAQDRDTSVVFGMPGEASRAGIVDKLLPLDQIGEDIARVAGVQAIS